MLGEHRTDMIHRRPYGTKLARACIALAAAYALTLQVLLLSITAAGAAMTPVQADALVICYGSGNTADGEQPLHAPGFADCTLACAQGLSATAILPSDIAPVLVFATGHPLEPAFAAAFTLSPRSSPRLAQGPPQIA
jgi:hypothetical protein